MLARRICDRAQELEGLGEMLDLPTFRDLCQDISTQIKAAAVTHVLSTATIAQQAWRHAQSLVIVGQRELIPASLEPGSASVSDVSVPPVLDHPVVDFALAEADAMDWEALALDDLDEIASSPEIPEITAEKVALSAPIPDTLDEIQDAVFEFLDLDTPAPTEPTPQVAPNPVSQNTVKTKMVTNANTMPSEEVAEAETVLRVPAQQLDQMGELFGELIIERNGLALQLKRLRQLTELLTQRVHSLESSNASLRNTYDTVATQTAIKIQSGEQSSPALALPSNQDSASQSIQGWLSDQAQEFDLLEMDRYSELHTLSQSLMESAVQIEEVTTDINLNLEEAEQTARAFTRTTKQLQVSMTQMRMRPVSDVLKPLFSNAAGLKPRTWKIC
ncbi:MAG: hypothetical protein HC790_13885 [Acaryochloridaceae cyanobacterium CSU_3_4]|nr:hypothetical protein [Acaryochloridaceae cyanobacterium CSU_3_4]